MHGTTNLAMTNTPYQGLPCSVRRARAILCGNIKLVQNMETASAKMPIDEGVHEILREMKMLSLE